MLINDSRELFTPQTRESLPYTPIIVTDSLKTPENIGNLIRIAANIGINKIISIEDIALKDSKIKKTACMAWDYVELVRTSADQFHTHIPDDYDWIALETTPTSVSIYKTILPDKMALFLGNEIWGIQPTILNRCRQHIHIPMTGPATSMNVSHAATAALFEWLRQQLV
jgi:tRNA G18 (ribose-2'-O)-methylase SpoU